MNPKLVGTWFLVRNNTDSDHRLVVCKARRVIPSPSMKGAFSADGMESGWMYLEKGYNDSFGHTEFADITPEDFLALDLPEVTYETSPLEIEIMPSGKVYFY